MSFEINGPSGSKLEITAENEAKCALTTVIANAGYCVIVSEVDDGSVVGTSTRRSPETSADYRLRCGIDTMVASWQFPGTAIDTTMWTVPATTMTATVANGFVTLNATSSIAVNATVMLASRRAFPAWGSFTTWLEMNTQFSSMPVAQNNCEWGFLLASGVATPTDGAFFRINSLGELRAILNYNGAESQGDILDFSALVGVNTTKNFLIGLHNSSVTFWIDDIKVAEFALPAAAAAMNSAVELPVAFRNYNAAIAPTTAQQMKIGACNVTLGEYHGTKRHDHIMAGMSGGYYQGQTGGVLGSTSNITNGTGAALPAAVLPTNTTAALGSGLGGFFHELATGGVNTDLIIQSYQVPALATNAVNKALYITGVHIESFVDAALTLGGYNSLWTLCFGSTAVSLATAESNTTKAPRRISLGNQAVPAAAAALTALNVIERRFDTPILVQPGEFIQVVQRKIGTASTAGSLVHAVSFDGYWE